jgi:glycogen synthase
VRILVVSNLYPPEILGGYEILCRQVCQDLERRGHEVRVLATGQDTTQANVDRSLRLVLPFSQPARKDRIASLLTHRHNYRQATRTIAAFQPDVIFCWSQLRLTLGAMRASQASGRPVLYTINDEHLTGYLPSSAGRGIRSWVGWFLDQTLFRHLTLQARPLPVTTTISCKVAENLARQGVRLPENRVIYQGIPVEQFPLKEHPGRLNDPVRILYVGQLHPYKGVHRILEAVAVLEQSVQVSIVGEGPEDYKARLRELAEGLEVTFYGKVPHLELPALYRDHDIFVFPSIWEEPFGLTHLEAMASGLPVISTVNGGQGEFLAHGENCLAIQPDDADSIRSALEQFFQEPELAHLIAGNGRRIVEERFTTHRYIDELEQFLEEFTHR